MAVKGFSGYNNAAFIVPYRTDNGGRRDELWRYVHYHLVKNHVGVPIYVGKSPDGPFNRGAAINDGARRAIADGAKVLIIHDADTIAQPWMTKVAKDHARKRVCFPFTTYTYLDKRSSNAIMAPQDKDGWFLAPEHHQDGFLRSVRHHHCSGIQAIPVAAYEAVGGFVELTGWGAEDQVMMELFKAFWPYHAPEWLPGGAYHLWHEANRNDPLDVFNVVNHTFLDTVRAYAHLGDDQLRAFLARRGHTVPVKLG